jgi:hypothetical protein
MADVKISGLPASTVPLAGTEVLPIVQGGTTKQVSIANVTAGRAISATSITTDTYKAASSSGGALQNSGGTPQLQWGAGGGNNLSVDVAININPANAAVAISPTGTGTVAISPAGALTINPTAASTINNTSIGASTRSSGAFTTLDANAAVGLSPANAAVAISPTGTGTVAISPAGALTINPTTASTINNTSIGASTPSTGKFSTAETTGKFSIGTAPTAGVFHYVVGSNSTDIVGYWANNFSTLMYTGIGNITYASGENAAATTLIIRKNPTTNRSINAAGTINASGADYAEYMEKSGNFAIAKGDICGIDVNGKLTNVFADAVSFVVKSTNPSYVGGDVWGNEEALGLTKPKQPEDDATDEEKAQYATNKTAFDAALEAARQNVDRIAFCGQVPVNVTDATAGQYIIPVNDNGAIKGEAVSNPTFDQYQIAVGKVISVKNNITKIIVKIS